MDVHTGKAACGKEGESVMPLQDKEWQRLQGCQQKLGTEAQTPPGDINPTDTLICNF